MASIGSFLPDLSERTEAEEWMDDFSLDEDEYGEALADLRRINRLLGGYRATDAVLDPVLKRRDHLSLLDLGCGGGDLLAHLAFRAKAFDCELAGVGIDANPAIVEWAQNALDRRLPPSLREKIHIESGDALNLSYGKDEFDVTHAALFLHHFHGPNPSYLLREMERLSRSGVVINDLHRHPLAYIGIWTLSRILRMSPMVQHDGPISVRRGFSRGELESLGREADIASPRIQWHWAFRWTLTTLHSDPGSAPVNRNGSRR